jgi:hypothetical protein
MKTTKKLALQAQTVRILNAADLGNVVGGKTTMVTCTCPTTLTTTFNEAKLTLRCTR